MANRALIAVKRGQARTDMLAGMSNAAFSTLITAKAVTSIAKDTITTITTSAIKDVADLDGFNVTDPDPGATNKNARCAGIFTVVDSTSTRQQRNNIFKISGVSMRHVAVRG